jgi:hypothetical protein
MKINFETLHPFLEGGTLCEKDEKMQAIGGLTVCFSFALREELPETVFQ